ncbi:MAG: hypothetical protein ACYTFY_03305 [Planctomycetota bacterium]
MDSRLRGIVRNTIRGSAMTELLLLTFPYAMILIGITVLGMLALGKQEARKATLLAAPWPGVQDFDQIQNLVFTGMTSNERMDVSFSEENDYTPEQYYSDQEPVLPYTDSSEAGEENDIHAGFVRIGYTSRSVSNISAGEVTTEESTVLNSTGQYLENYGISPDREDDVAEALNGWIDYSRVTANFSYTYGGEAAHFEERAAEYAPDSGQYEARNFRDSFVLRDYDGEEGLKSFSAAKTDEDRGSHQNSNTFEPDNVELSEIRDLPGIATTFQMQSPGSMYSSGGDGQDYDSWDVLNFSSDWSE